MAKKKPPQEVILNEEDALSFLDWQAPEEHLEPDIFQYLQWNNGVAAWEFPLDQWGGSNIAQVHEAVEIVHDMGQVTELGMLLETINISVIAHRTTWEKENAEGKRVYSSNYEPGMRKRYNFLVLIREVGGFELAVITARGYTGGYIEVAIKDHKQSVLKLASKLANGTKFPPYMFWLPLTAGDKVFVGGEKKSEIQPPAPVYNDLSGLDDAGIRDIVEALYIGDELREAITGYLFDEGQSWKNEHEQHLLSGPDDPPSIEVLPGGNLVIPDLSAEKRGGWIEIAMTIPGLFKAREHAGNALAQVLRDKVLLPRGSDQTAQWEAWRNDLDRRHTKMLESQEAVAIEAQLQTGG